MKKRLAMAALCSLVACGHGESTERDSEPPALKLPPRNGTLDYQLGEPYTPPAGVNVLSRDRTAEPAEGLYNICYVNGFQVQPGEEESWAPDLLLRDAQGEPVIDPDWDEAILDTSSEDKRRRIADKVGGWIDDCADAGFAAIEIDNLDTFSRTEGRLSADDAVQLMALFAERAHQRGLAIAQKNSAELLDRKAEMRTDFVVSEECAHYDECQDYVAVYGDAVLMIEYTREDFDKGCAQLGDSHAIVLRDRDLVAKGEPDYVYEGC